MSAIIRDLEHRFNADGRAYAVQVCGCGNHAAPVSGGPVDIVLFECVPDHVLDHEDDDPHAIVRLVTQHAKARLPASIPTEQWEEFANAVYEWVCEHRRAAADTAHAQDVEHDIVKSFPPPRGCCVIQAVYSKTVAITFRLPMKRSRVRARRLAPSCASASAAAQPANGRG
jgi:hypothetical protein